MSALSLLAGAFGWGIATLLAARSPDGCFLHPRLACAVNGVASGACVFGAYRHGAGSWTGLLFAALALFGAWRTFEAGADSWAAWSVKRDPVGVARKVAAWREKREKVGPHV